MTAVMEDMLLFVYGTLRRGTGHAMARRLADEAMWLGAATVEGRLYRVDWYPALVPASGLVVGDLFRLGRCEVSLAWIDAYEGCGADDVEPHEYRRAWIAVDCGGKRLRAQTYIWNRPLEGLSLIGSGDWLRA